MPPEGGIFIVSLIRFRYHRRILQPIMYIRQHSFGMQPDVHGFSPGLKNMPPACFLPLLRRDSNPGDTFMPYEISSASRLNGSNGIELELAGSICPIYFVRDHSCEFVPLYKQFPERQNLSGNQRFRL